MVWREDGVIGIKEKGCVWVVMIKGDCCDWGRVLVWCFIWSKVYGLMRDEWGYRVVILFVLNECI